MADDDNKLQGAVISVDPLAAAVPAVPQAPEQSAGGAVDPGQIPQSPMQAPITETVPGVGRELPSMQTNNPPSQLSREQSDVKKVDINSDKPRGPLFFGYKPPKWVHDFDYVRLNKGQGKVSDAKTWLLYTVDRILKSHSV
jgi:hypothetical protein